MNDESKNDTNGKSQEPTDAGEKKEKTSLWKTNKIGIIIGASAIVVLIVLIAILSKHEKKGPEYVSFTISQPKPTKLQKDAKIDTLRLIFSKSVAELADLGKILKEKVSIKPSIKGSWSWITDKTLEFKPLEDWGVGQRYEVNINKELFPEHIKIDAYSGEFAMSPFTVEVTKTKFYQDPRYPKEKRAVVNLKFNYPVDGEDLRKRIKMTLKDDVGGIASGSGEDYKFTVSFDEFAGQAYIKSDTVPIPLKNSVMLIKIGPGIRSAKGGSPSSYEAEQKVKVPGMYSYFRINSVRLVHARNEKYEPEQILVVASTAETTVEEIKKAIKVYELPKYNIYKEKPDSSQINKKYPYRWRAVGEITDAVLKDSNEIKLEALPTEKDYSSAISFKYFAEVGRYLYVKIDKGIKSYGDYILSKNFESVNFVPELPQELMIMHKGSLLSMTGEKKLTILTRNIEALHFEIARVIPSQINHLMSQTYGNFNDPSFEYWKFDKTNISEFFTETKKVTHSGDYTTHYTTLDFSTYFKSAGNVMKGLFFLKVNAWDPISKRIKYPSDRRFLLITDLGMLIKKGIDNSHNVFVQSISTGKPVPGAKVEIIGKNGIPVATQITDSGGRADFMSLKDFKNEKHPVVYLVRNDKDLTFLPFDVRDRGINFVRFDTGGIYESTTGALKAFIFSDRGIYRPGDEMRLGTIVRSEDWKARLSMVPVEILINDPKGVIVHKERRYIEPPGLAEIKYQTYETSPTGSYRIQIYLIKNDKRWTTLGSETVKVEEFLPDRMKISARISEQRFDGWVHPEDLKGLVTLRNLFGTPAEDRRVTGQISLSPTIPFFRKYRKYIFHDPEKAKKGFTETLEETVTDSEGNAQFNFELNRFEEATYRLTFTSQGYEAKGGRSVSSQAEVVVSPLKYIVGYKSEDDLSYISKNSTREIEFIAVDKKLENVATDNLFLELYDQKYVSVLTEDRDGTFRYKSVLKDVLLEKSDFSIPKEGLNYALKVDTPGEFKLVIKNSDKKELSKVKYSIVGKADLAMKMDKSAELQVVINKTDYRPGELIEMQIRAPYTGAGLITIERDKVYSYKWFKTLKTNTVETIKVPGNLEGNAYVNVTFVRAIDSDEIFISPLSYGVVPFSIAKDKRTNKITLFTDEMIKPGEPFKIRYKSEKPGKGIIFAIDEGILQVANYQMPNPLAYFFRKRALQVRTMQILDLIIPEYAIVRELYGEGGGMYGEKLDAIGKNLNPFKRKTDKPVAYWSGIVDMGPDEKEVIYEVPDYFNGTIRIMAVAVSEDALGALKQKAIVRGDFVIQPNAPLFAAPGDQFEVGVLVANMVEGSGKNAGINVNIEPSEHFSIVGEKSKKLKIDEQREKSETFIVKAKDVLGPASLTFRAKMDDKSGKYKMGLSVRPQNPYITSLTTGYVHNDSKELKIDRVIYPHFRSLSLMASPSLVAAGHGLLSYLKEFPYGCTEQTVSKAFPAVAFKGRPEFGASIKKIEQSISHAIGVLRSRQRGSGAFGFWSAHSYVDNFQNAYAIHFLTEAKDKGYPVSKDFFQRGLKYLQSGEVKQADSLYNARVWAYALYVLARNGIVVKGDLPRLHKALDQRYKKSWHKDMTAIYMAAAYRLVKMKKEAKALISESRMGDPQKANYNHYYDQLIRDAQYLYIVTKHFPELLTEIKPEDLKALVNMLEGGKYNTTSSAYLLLAISEYSAYMMKQFSEGLMNFKVEEYVSKDSKKELKRESGSNAAGLYTFSPEAKKLKLSAKGKFPIFYQMVLSGFDRNVPNKAVKQKIEAIKEYQNSSGSIIEKTTMGSNLKVVLRIRALDNEIFNNVALVDLVPGGFDPVLERDVPTGEYGLNGFENFDSGYLKNSIADLFEKMIVAAMDEIFTSAYAQSNTALKSFNSDYVDRREDRMLIFGTVTSDVREFEYEIRAVSKGTFITPPVFAQSMYDKTVQARGLSTSLTVE